MKSNMKRLWGSYCVDNMIHVGDFGFTVNQILTKGHEDYKPSWSKTGNKIVFFRKVVDHVIPGEWKNSICVIDSDGTKFRKLTDGTSRDFNPTWTRDGKNLVIFNRKTGKSGECSVMMTTSTSKPGMEYSVSDSKDCFHCVGFSCLSDGRIFVHAYTSKFQLRYYLMTPGKNGRAKFEPLEFQFAEKGLADRISVSPKEKKICFEYQGDYDLKSHSNYRYEGRILCIADLDVKNKKIDAVKIIANKNRNKTASFLYPRWSPDGKSVLYHSNTAEVENGRDAKQSPSQIYLNGLGDGKTMKLSCYRWCNFMFPHGEATPK